MSKTTKPALTHYLKMFFAEKDIDMDEGFVVEGKSGPNHMTYGVVVEHIKIASKDEQRAIGDMIRRIDLANASVKDYLRHLAQAIAK
jgi:hypothetical protein